VQNIVQDVRKKLKIVRWLTW